MAQVRQVRTYQITIPHGTPIASPTVTALTMPPSVVEWLSILIPDGCRGNVGFAIGAAGQAVIPYTVGTWIVGNDETIDLELWGQIDSGAWEFFGYNLGQYDHTIYVRIGTNPVAEPSAAPTLPIDTSGGLGGTIPGGGVPVVPGSPGTFPVPVTVPPAPIATPPPPIYTPPPPVATPPPPTYTPPPPVASPPPPVYTPPPPVASPPPPVYTPPPPVTVPPTPAPPSGTGTPTPGSGQYLSPVPASATAPAAKTPNFTVESPGGWWHDPNNSTVQWLQRTSHYLAGGFSQYYWHNGSGATFGGPVSEEFHDPTSGAQSSQEFEHGRMEWWPGTRPDNWDVWWLAGS